MEVSGVRQFRGHLGSEKHQMLELNKRLETYLSRVKLLEEENEFLKDEIQALQGSRRPPSWKGELEDQLRRAREELEAAWNQRDRVELELGNLREDLQALQLQRQKEAVGQAEAKKRLGESKRELEEETRAQIWLREKVAQLEKELQLQLEIHQEEVSHLQANLSHARPVIISPQHSEVPGLQDLSLQFSQSVTRAWQEAATTYQDQVKRLEDSLSRAKDHMTQVTQEKREGNLMMQRLAKELDGAQMKKKLLEEQISQQRKRDLMELESLQAHMEALEVEKAHMREQITDIMDDRHNLLQLKMSLGLEVATYRALLDNESLRVDKPSINSPWGSFTDNGGSSLRVVKQRPSAVLNSSLITTPVSIKLGKRTPATELTMTTTPVQFSKQNASKQEPKGARFSELEGGWSVETSQPAVWSTPHSKDGLKENGLVNDFREKDVQEEITQVPAVYSSNSATQSQEPSGSDISMEEKDAHSLTAESEIHPALDDAVTNVEQSPTDYRSTVFSTDIPLDDAVTNEEQRPADYRSTVFSADIPLDDAVTNVEQSPTDYRSTVFSTDIPLDGAVTNVEQSPTDDRSTVFSTDIPLDDAMTDVEQSPTDDRSTVFSTDIPLDHAVTNVEQSPTDDRSTVFSTDIPLDDAVTNVEQSPTADRSTVFSTDIPSDDAVTNVEQSPTDDRSTVFSTDTPLDDAVTNVEQSPTDYHSTVFSADIPSDDAVTNVEQSPTDYRSTVFSTDIPSDDAVTNVEQSPTDDRSTVFSTDIPLDDAVTNVEQSPTDYHSTVFSADIPSDDAVTNVEQSPTDYRSTVFSTNIPSDDAVTNVEQSPTDDRSTVFSTDIPSDDAVTNVEQSPTDYHSTVSGADIPSDDAVTNVEQSPTDYCSTVFSADIPLQFHPETQASVSPSFAQNLSEAGLHQALENCEDVGAKGSVETAIEPARAPLLAWGEREEVEQEIELEYDPEFEVGSGSDIKDLDFALNSRNDDKNFSGFNQCEQDEAKLDSVELKAAVLSEKILSDEGKVTEGPGDENENNHKSDGDDMPVRFGPEEKEEDEVVPEKERVDSWNGDKVCESEADGTVKNKELSHDNELEQRETKAAMDKAINGITEYSAMEVNDKECNTEIAAVSADVDLISQAGGNLGDVRQEPISSNAEQQEFFEEDGDNSQNGSHSWRTEGGDLESNGSYSLENTLADTRPLIRYKSDEADMSTHASLLGDSDLSEDEITDDKGCWGEDKRRVITSKSVEFMDDLDEEPEREAEKEAEEHPQKEDMDATTHPRDEMISSNEDDEVDRVVEVGAVSLQVETPYMAIPAGALMDQIENSNKEGDSAHKYPAQETDSLSHPSEDAFKGEVLDSEAAVGHQPDLLHNEQEDIETLQPVDSANDCRDVSSHSHSDTEKEVQGLHAETLATMLTSLSSLLQDSSKHPPFSETEAAPPTQSIHADENRGGGADSEKGEVLPDKTEELSMLTNVDFADELSLHSELSSTVGSVINTANSDLDEYSSGDDSPNASQTLQSIEQEDNSFNESDTRINTRNLFEGFGESEGHSLELSDLHPLDVTNNVPDHGVESDAILQDQGDIVESPSAKHWGYESFAESAENIVDCSQIFSDNENKIGLDYVAEEKLKAVSQPSGDSPHVVLDEEDDTFKVTEIEALPQTNGKCHDHHNLLSITLHEDTWSSTKRIEATCDPQEGLGFGISWEATQNLLGSSEHAEEDMVMSQASSYVEQKQISLPVKLLSGVKMEDSGSHSEGSLEEGYSWSSGEE